MTVCVTVGSVKPLEVDIFVPVVHVVRRGGVDSNGQGDEEQEGQHVVSAYRGAIVAHCRRGFKKSRQAPYSTIRNRFAACGALQHSC